MLKLNHHPKLFKVFVLFVFFQFLLFFPFKEIGLINFTSSVPRGFYFFDDGQITKNDYVAVLNMYNYPLVKKIIAVPGDKYVLSLSGVYINDVLIGKYNGGPTVNIDEGILKKNEYIVLGENVKSYDSRHFGKLSVNDLLKLKRFCKGK